jgi:hypothetical protein
MYKRNSIRTFIALFLLLLSTGTMLVKSVHCVLIPHEVSSVILSTQTTVSPSQGDACPICSFDFYPVIIHSLNLLPAVQVFSYSETTSQLSDEILRQAIHLFLLRAPPSV